MKTTNHASGGLVSVQTAASRLALSHWTLRHWIAAGKLPSVKIHGAVRLRAADLDALIEAGLRNADARLALPGVEPGEEDEDDEAREV